MQSSSSGLNWEIDNALRSEVWLAHEALKPMCDALSAHVGQSSEEDDVLLARLSVLRDEFEQLPRRGVQMCVVMVGPHLIGLLQLYSVSKNLFGKEKIVGKVDQVVDSLLESIKVLLSVIERVDAPFAESVSVCLARLLSNASLAPSQTSASSSPLSLISKASPLASRLFSAYSEDTRRYIAQIILLTLQKASPIAISALSTQKHLTSLFYIVSQLLDIATYDRNRENQSLALQACLRVFNPSIALKVSSEDASTIMAELVEEERPENRKFGTQSLASILPGTLSSASKILLGDYKQGQDVFVNAFRLLSEAICATLNDKENETLLSSSIGVAGAKLDSKSAEDAMSKLRSMMKSKQIGEEGKEGKDSPTTSDGATSGSKNEKSQPEGVGKVEMDGGWYRNAVYHVNMVLGRIFSISRIMSEEVSKNVSMNLIVMRSVEVRKEMVKCVFKILKRCGLTLASSFPHLFEIMILFSFDDHQEVSQLSNKLLESIMIDFSKANQNLVLFRSLFTPHLSKLVHSIPRIAMHPEDAKKLLLLRLLSGWIKNFPDLFTSLLQPFLDALVGLATFTPFHHSMSLLSPTLSLLPSPTEGSQPQNNQNLAPSALAHTQQTYHHQFKLFRDPAIFQSMITLMRLIGAMGAMDQIFTILLPYISLHSPPIPVVSEEDLIESSPVSLQSRIPSSIFVLNHVILGASGFIDYSNQNRFKLSSMAKSNLASHWEHYLSIVMSEDVWKWEDSKNSVFRLVLIMEGLGNMAMVFGKAFKKFFANVLYRILSMAGSEVEILSRVGKLTLVRFAEHTGFESVVEMVKENSDYVVEEMTRELKYGEDVKGALNVFGGLLSISSTLIIHLMDDLIEDIFQRLDYRQEGHNDALLTILSQIIKIVSNRVPASQPSRLQIRHANLIWTGRAQDSKIQTPTSCLSNNAANPKTSNPSPPDLSSIPNAPSSTLIGSSLFDIYSNAPPTMHEWIRANELTYIGRTDIFTSTNQNSAETTSSPHLDPSLPSSSYQSLPSEGQKRLSSQGSSTRAESSAPSQKHSHVDRQVLFKAKLIESYQEEEEMAILSKTGLSSLSTGLTTASSPVKTSESQSQTILLLGSWLSKRLEARKRDSEFYSPSSHSTPDPSASSSVSDYFKEHHAKKEEEEERGDDLHQGGDTNQNPNEMEDIHSDEEYEGVEYLPDNGAAADLEGSEDSSSSSSSSDISAKNRKNGENFDSPENHSKSTQNGPKINQNVVRKVLPHRAGFDMVLRILNRLQHWMNNSDPSVRKLVLDSLKEGIEVLAEHKRVLLPFLHTIWSPLQWRFLDEDYRVVNEALEVMREMSKYGRSFLSRKFVDDLWPLLKLTAKSFNVYIPEGERKLARMNVETQYHGLGGWKSEKTETQTFLDTSDESNEGNGGVEDETLDSSSSKEGKRSSSNSASSSFPYPAYQHSSSFFSSSSYKTQISMLRTLLYAVEKLNLPEPVTFDIAQHTWFYLAQHQPKPLQEAAISIFKRMLESYNPNQTFYLLSQLHHSPISPPNKNNDKIHVVIANASEGSETTSSTLLLPTIVPSNILTPKKFMQNPSVMEAFYAQFHQNTSLLLHRQE